MLAVRSRRITPTAAHEASRAAARLSDGGQLCGGRAAGSAGGRRSLAEPERFGFDPEILFLAKRHGLRVAEVPVRWSHDSATKVNVVADGMRMLLDLLVIRWNALRGLYPRARKS